MGENSKVYSMMRAAALILVSIFAALSFIACGRSPKQTAVAPPPTVKAEQVNPWKIAAQKVEEDRGEPAGGKAQVEVPAELKHYSDRRRFLAMQVAEWREQNYSIPYDYAELINLIQTDKLVEVEPFGDDYILYGVGANATDSIFTHFDRQSKEDIPLYASNAEFEKDYEELTNSINEFQAKIVDLEKQVKQLGKRERERRKSLLAQIAEARKDSTKIVERRNVLASFYKNAERRKIISSEYQTIADLAADFGGKSYDLATPEERREMKVRLLSFIRPEARDVLFEIAHAYKEKFDRPLPVTSLVRTERYQRLLSETNPNATGIGVPPHTTGLAFDIYYYYMNAAEQDYLMSEIARLKNEGRVEALRENRNHIHVFAFADGKPPDESLVAKSLKEIGPGKVTTIENKTPRVKNNPKSRSVKVAGGRKTSEKPVARASSRRSAAAN